MSYRRRRPQAPEACRKVMARMGVSSFAYLSHDRSNIYTSQGTIENAWTGCPSLARPDVGETAGHNETGHRLGSASKYDDPRGYY